MAAAEIGVPQSAQNRPMAGAPHAGQAASRDAPQEGQNLAVVGTGSPQAEQVGNRYTSLVVRTVAAPVSG